MKTVGAILGRLIRSMALVLTIHNLRNPEGDPIRVYQSFRTYLKKNLSAPDCVLRVAGFLAYFYLQR